MPATAGLVQEQLLALRRSLTRIEAHRTALAALFPLDGRTLDQLGDVELMRIEALMKKFEQFVDDLRRIARGILLLAAEEVDGKSTRQLLDRLASLGAIDGAGGVIELIALRNRLTHDYPSAPDKQAAILTALHEKSAALRPLLAGIEAFIQRTALLPKTAG